MTQKFDDIRKDPYISLFAQKNGLSDEKLRENRALLTRVLSSRKACEGCPGLESCVQPSKGEVSSLEYDQVIYEQLEYCPYMVRLNDSRKHLQNYVYRDVPDKLLDIDLDNIRYTQQQEELYALLLGVLHGRRDKGLYISGPMGTGKTYLCTALANSLARKGKKVAFVKLSDFLSDMKGYIASGSEMLDSRIASLKKVPYLIIDDIGSEAVSEFVRDDILFNILDHRMENRLTTLFTSNLNKEDLFKHYQYDRKDKANSPKANRLVERIDILTDDYVLVGRNMRRE